MRRFLTRYNLARLVLLALLVGYRDMVEISSPDMLRILDHPELFEKTGVYFASEDIHTLEVYRMKPADTLAFPSR